MMREVSNIMTDFSSIKALTFDVFGTVVDWRSTIIREGKQLGESKRIQVDWVRFADAWRRGSGPVKDRVRRGELPWTSLDNLNRMILDQLLNEFGIMALSENEKDHLNRVWDRLSPWPDAIEGLTRLRRRFIVATLSNGNVALLVNMAKKASLPWDCILSSELTKPHYKPDKEVYQMAADLLGLRPDQIMMVAAHQDDLKAVKTVGFKTALVLRPLEFGPHRSVDQAPVASFDMIARDLNDLAVKLGV